MSNLVVIPGKMEDINKILNKDIKGIILGVKSLSIYPLELDIDSIIDIKNNLVKRGTIITDNLSFHGLVEDSDLVKTKNQRGISKSILFSFTTSITSGSLTIIASTLAFASSFK
jgi:hypothetical protein